MRHFEKLDLANFFIGHWSFVAEAHTRGLPRGLFTRTQVNSIESLRNAKVLNHQNRIDPMWRTAIDGVSAGRSVYELSDDEKIRIVFDWAQAHE